MTDIFSLLILSLNKAKISERINILHYLVECLYLENIVKDKIILTKYDDLTIKNMTYILYQK